MATLAVEKPRGLGAQSNILPESYDMIAADKIFHGAAVGMTTTGSPPSPVGNVRPLVGGDPFVGFAVETVDNTSGAAAARKVKVAQQGVAILPIASIAKSNYGATVYATDDDTFTLSSTGGTAIGKVVGIEGAGLARVFFQGAYVRSI